VDQQQTQNINQAMEQLADSAQQSFQMLADRTVRVQERSLMLTLNFFQNRIEQVHNQAQATREATQDLQEQSQSQREAFDTLSQEATNVYSEFLDSALSFYQEAMSRAMQLAQGNMQQAAQVIQQSVQTGARAVVETGGASISPNQAATHENGTSNQVTERILKGEISMADISQFVDKDYEQQEFNELAEAPVDAIQGVSKGDAEKL
jgi:CRISPR/Cas system CMR subunit Cmr6 (Cas7 group RAMP superfamily)